MSGRLDKEETAMDTCVLNIPFSLGGEFLAEIGGMLILYVLDNRVPAIIGISLSVSSTITLELQ